jgi:hypothetical protein
MIRIYADHPDARQELSLPIGTSRDAEHERDATRHPPGPARSR